MKIFILNIVNLLLPSSLNYLWNFGSINGLSSKSLKIHYEILGYRIALHVKWSSKYIIRLFFAEKCFKLNITRKKKLIIRSLKKCILFGLTKIYEMIYCAYTGFIGLLLFVGLSLLVIVYLSLLVIILVSMSVIIDLLSYINPLLPNPLSPDQGISLYGIHEWIAEAISIADETMKGWSNPMIPQGGGGSNWLAGSTGQEFIDLKNNYMRASNDVFVQESYMLDLIKQRNHLLNYIDEQTYVHQNDMHKLYQLHLNTRDAKNTINNNISSACVDLGSKRDIFKETVQSLRDYLKK